MRFPGQSKSKQVRDILNTRSLDPNWCLPSKIDRNPLAWMISIDGFIVDARTLPRHIQEAAHANGFIPYIPNARSEDIDSKQVSSHSNSEGDSSTDALYVLDVFLIDGPITEKFVAKNPVISRTIEIKGSNKLSELHQIIFKAFDRHDEHMYEFQVGGRGPQDPNARRYGLKQAFSSDDLTEAPIGDVSNTQIGSLGLSVEDAFGYWFDFGDDWWHQINVAKIMDKAPSGNYPRISKRVGASPPQYADFD